MEDELEQRMTTQPESKSVSDGCYEYFEKKEVWNGADYHRSGRKKKKI